MHSIEEWKNIHPEKIPLIEKAVSDCLVSKWRNENDGNLEELMKPDKPLVTVYDCFIKHDLPELADKLKQQDEIIETVAWPLSMLE